MKNKTILQSILMMGGLLLIGLFLTAALPGNPTGPGTPADSTVSQLTAATTAAGTDVYYIVSGGSSKKITHAVLMSIIRDSILARNYYTAGDWSFDGGTFDAGSAGKVTFNDSVLFAGGWYATSNGKVRTIYPITDDTYALGNSIYRWISAYSKYVYADYFVLTNPVAPTTDTILISYDGSKITFGADVNFTGEIQVTDSLIYGGIALSEYEYTFSLTTDSVITIPQVESSVKLSAGFDVADIETINMTNAGNGQFVVFQNLSNQTLTLKDNDDNLRLAGNFAMGQYDIITLKFNKYKSVTGEWYEISRSNN